MLTREQLVGLGECLPAGYPSSGGLIVLRGKKGHSRKVKRRRAVKVPSVPWYMLFPRY